MQTSPGSMVNQYRFEDDEAVPGTKDIFITVDNPESHVTAIETFITYRVLTKVCPEPQVYDYEKDLFAKYYLTIFLMIIFLILCYLSDVRRHVVSLTQASMKSAGATRTSFG